MEKPSISIIAALQRKNRGIGMKNKLLWQIPEDLQRFKKLTSGHPIIMGENTYKSIGRALPNRTNIILTRNPDFHPEGCTTVFSLDEAFEKARSLNTEIFVIGGGEVYRQTISLANKLYLTIIDAENDADTFFPEYSAFSKILFEEKHSDSKLVYTFLELGK